MPHPSELLMPGLIMSLIKHCGLLSPAQAAALPLPSVNTNLSNGCHKLGVCDIMSVFIGISKCVLNKTETTHITQAWTLHTKVHFVHDTVWVRWNHCSLHWSAVLSSGQSDVSTSGVPTPGGWHWPLVTSAPGLINISSKHFNTDSKYLTAHHNSLCCVIWEACATWVESVLLQMTCTHNLTFLAKVFWFYVFH